MSSETFHTDKREVRRSFNKAAVSYDAAAVLQREIAARLVERLELVAMKPQHVLDAGSGTGHLAERLRAFYPRARVSELDLAPAMLAESIGKTSWLGRMLGRSKWAICGDMEAVPVVSNTFEMVCSNLALQWMNTPDAAFAEMHRVLKPDGLFMFTTFGPDTLQELRHAFAGVDGDPHVNRFIDMHDLGDALVRTGFSGPVMDMEKIVLTYADMKAAMRDLKSIGAHNAALGRRRGLTGKNVFAQAASRYETLRREGRLPLTYEVIYGHAWKPTPKMPASDVQVLQFHPRKPG